REANGRTQLAFLHPVSLRAGYPLDLTKLRPDPFLDAMIKSFHGALRPLERDSAGCSSRTMVGFAARKREGPFLGSGGRSGGMQTRPFKVGRSERVTARPSAANAIAASELHSKRTHRRQQSPRRE